MRNTISQRLKKYRFERNLTQEEMAKEIGISVTTYNHLEQGNTSVYTGTIDKLAEFFCIDVIAVRKLLK